MNIKRIIGSILVAALAVVSLYGIEETKLFLFPNKGTMDEFVFEDLQDVNFHEIAIEKTIYSDQDREDYIGVIRAKDKVNEEIEKLGKIRLNEVSRDEFQEKRREVNSKANSERYSIHIYGRREERIDENEIYLREIKVRIDSFTGNEYIELYVDAHKEKSEYKFYKIEEGSIDYQYLDNFLKEKL